MKRIVPRIHLAISALVMCHNVAVETQAPEKRRKGERIKGLQPCGPVMSGRSTFRRNGPCPCGSGNKFKDCCREKV